MNRHSRTWLAVTLLLALGACKQQDVSGVDAALVGQDYMDSVHSQCVRDGGEFLAAQGGHICTRFADDAGKSCDSAQDCQSACLARSRSCAPVTPLLGCNEILTDNGAAVMQCIE